MRCPQPPFLADSACLTYFQKFSNWQWRGHVCPQVAAFHAWHVFLLSGPLAAAGSGGWRKGWGLQKEYCITQTPKGFGYKMYIVHAYWVCGEVSSSPHSHLRTLILSVKKKLLRITLQSKEMNQLYSLTQHWGMPIFLLASPILGRFTQLQRGWKGLKSISTTTGSPLLSERPKHLLCCLTFNDVEPFYTSRGVCVVSHWVWAFSCSFQTGVLLCSFCSQSTNVNYSHASYLLSSFSRLSMIYHVFLLR